VRTRTRRGLWTIAATTALIGALAGPANAGASDNGTDPSTAPHYCNTNAGLIATRPIETELGQVVSYVDVYYSYSCQTNWIRVRNNPAGGAAIKVIGSDAAPWPPAEIDYGPGSSYSMQVYAPGSTCIHFSVHLNYPDGSHYAETYDPGANYITIC
jgi:hypothetical protein